MIRHGIVVPGAGTLQQCGGPAWCGVCNAEMIELEDLALRCAVQYERRQGRSDDEEALAKRWMYPSYNRQFRNSARQIIRLRLRNEAQLAEMRAKKVIYEKERRIRDAASEAKLEQRRLYRATPEAKALARERQRRYKERKINEQRGRD